MGDMRAQFAACRAAEQRLTELVERYGVADVQVGIENAFRRRPKPGVAASSRPWPMAPTTRIRAMDHDFADLDVPVEIDVTVTVSGST